MSCDARLGAAVVVMLHDGDPPKYVHDDPRKCVPVPFHDDRDVDWIARQNVHCAHESFDRVVIWEHDDIHDRDSFLQEAKGECDDDVPNFCRDLDAIVVPGFYLDLVWTLGTDLVWTARVPFPVLAHVPLPFDALSDGTRPTVNVESDVILVELHHELRAFDCVVISIVLEYDAWKIGSGEISIDFPFELMMSEMGEENKICFQRFQLPNWQSSKR